MGSKSSCPWQFRFSWKALNTYFRLLRPSKTTYCEVINVSPTLQIGKLRLGEVR